MYTRISEPIVGGGIATFFHNKVSFYKIKWNGHVENLRKVRNSYTILVGNMKERTFWRPRHRWSGP
jgi:hypothetical protein